MEVQFDSFWTLILTDPIKVRTGVTPDDIFRVAEHMVLTGDTQAFHHVIVPGHGYVIDVVKRKLQGHIKQGCVPTSLDSTDSLSFMITLQNFTTEEDEIMKHVDKWESHELTQCAQVSALRRFMMGLETTSVTSPFLCILSFESKLKVSKT